MVFSLLAISFGFLIPGLLLPVLTIRGVLTRDGVAQVAPTMLEKGLNEETMTALRAMINPTVVGLLDATGGDLRQMIIDRLSPQLTASLRKNVEDVEVYQQTRSIIGSVRKLYQVGSPVPATLILIFSIVVPLAKSVMVGVAMYLRNARTRQRVLGVIEIIAKWSMADVFVVGLFITYLAAQASQVPPGDPTAASLVVFSAHVGAGFYWFTAYCLFSLASQQFTARALAPRIAPAVTSPGSL